MARFIWGGQDAGLGSGNEVFWQLGQSGPFPATCHRQDSIDAQGDAGIYMQPMLPTQCLCTKLRRATRNVTRLYDDALAGVGVNVAQYSLLKNLARLDQPSITSLAEAMGLDRSTLGRNLKVLEAKGLVLLEGGEDQRNRLVSLTPAGRNSLDQALQAWERVQQDMGQRMGPEKRAALMALLDDLEHIA